MALHGTAGTLQGISQPGSCSALPIQVPIQVPPIRGHFLVRFCVFTIKEILLAVAANSSFEEYKQQFNILQNNKGSH